MSGEIKRIDYVKNMAVFHDFQWVSSVKDGGNNIAEFKKINILYGRNYSGKTTLSRIIRSLETGLISDKYDSPLFQLTFEYGIRVDQGALNTHGQVVRVFNEDFIKENLSFIFDNEKEIKSFAILGEDNARLEAEIERYESELGSGDERTGLVGKLLNAEKLFKDAHKLYDDKLSGLEEKLKDKANKTGTGIKHNKTYGDANYNVNKIKADILKVLQSSYSPPTDEQKNTLYELLRSEPKKEIKESPAFNLQYSTIASKAQVLIEKKIQVSETIQDLLGNALLSSWVRNGRELHQDKRVKCAFCGNDLPDDLWVRLNKHFNKESEDLRDAIDGLIRSIDLEKKHIANNLLKINNSEFYSNFTDDLNSLSEQFKKYSSTYCANLEAIKKQLDDRKINIFRPQVFEKPESKEQELNAIRDFYEKLRIESNNTTSKLALNQSAARETLRLHEVSTFITDIKYNDECNSIAALKMRMDEAEILKTNANIELAAKKTQICELKAQLKDESKGADRVNGFLNNFFGHQSLSLKAIEESSTGVSSGYRFEVTRNGQKAFHLSEGECSLIAFCYFMAKLDDVETKGNKPIIWIDDPISSLDANHIFFVYSLINAEIVKNKIFKQLFISTHSLDFLKYLKQVSNDYKGKGQNKTKIREFFLLERRGNTSSLLLMPQYLKNYVTEFNYLFHQIYKCATVDHIDDKNHHILYNFGNNARKFLEIYLYYKYPNGKEGDEKLTKFFGDQAIPAILTDRINNEYSHLCGIFERGSSPIQIPEMKTTAQLILTMIQKDRDQYIALLQSIGADEDTSDMSQELQ